MPPVSQIVVLFHRVYQEVLALAFWARVALWALALWARVALWALALWARVGLKATTTSETFLVVFEPW